MHQLTFYDSIKQLTMTKLTSNLQWWLFNNYTFQN